MSLARLRVWMGWTLLIGSLVATPVSAVTWAKHEPITVLVLSWLAITLTALDILFTATVAKKQDEG